MGWLWAIIVGLVLGVIARAILPGKQDIPLWLTTIFGIIGALIGNAVAAAIGVADTRGVDWIRLALNLAGAVAVVAVGTPLWAQIRGHKRHSPRAP